MISVIIPTKNRSNELKRAVFSVLNQTFQDFEVLIIDDHSDEDIKKIVSDFKDQRLKYYKSDKQPSNANVCRNIGVANAQGAYIAMLDSDDEWLPDHLEKKIKYIEESNADGIFGSIIINDSEKQWVVYSRERRRDEAMINYLLSGGWAPTPTHFYKSVCAKEIKWDETLLRNQDLDFSVRFAERFTFIPAMDATCIVHWKKNEKRVEHLASQKKFLQSQKGKINRNIYCKYHAEIYHQIKSRNDIEKDIQEYFKKESVRYPHAFGLTTYLEIMAHNKSVAKRILLRCAYITRVLLNIK